MISGAKKLCAAELSAKVAGEGIDPDALDGLGFAMQPVELAAPLGVAEAQPVGGLVACAGEARLLDEGLKQHRSIGVSDMPVFDQATGGESEDPRGEVLALDPRQDEEAGVVDDEVKVVLSLLACPTDELVARLSLPGARAERQQSDHFSGCAHEVAQLGARHQLMTEIMVTLDVGVPQQRLTLLADRIDYDLSQIHCRSNKKGAGEFPMPAEK